MSIDRETVRRVAHLARIRLDEDRLDPLAEELSGIVQWIEQLGEVDTEGVTPMASVVDMTAVWREDVATDGSYPDKIVANAPAPAPAHLGDFFTVPKVVE